MNISLELNSKQHDDLIRYCELNKFNVDEIVKKSYLEGFAIEKYGLLGNTGGVQEKQVEIEVIREKRVEIPVEVIKEVIVEKEVVKEIPVEKIVTKTEYITDDTKVNELIQKIKELESREPEIIEKEVIKETRVEIPVEVIKEVIVEKPVEVIVEKKIVDDKSKMLQETLQSLRKELNLKNEKIKQLEQSLKDLESIATSKGAVFLKNSNINENL